MKDYEIRDMQARRQRVFDAIVAEHAHQDSKYEGNDEKPLEVWMLLAEQYMREAVALYAHGSQTDARKKLGQAAALAVRGLMTPAPGGPGNVV